jgi:glycosyltransferase 2 family protein
MKRWQSILIGVVVSVATLAFALRGVRIDQLGDEFVRGRYVYILPALVFVGLGLALRAVRWRALLNRRITMPHSFNILNVSYLFNTLLPLRLGEVARAFLATRLEPPIAMFTSLSSVVVERLTDVLAVVICIILAILIAPVTPEIEGAARISGIIAVAGMLILAVFAARRSFAHRLLDVALRLFPFLERLHTRDLADHVLDGIAPLGSVRGSAAIFSWTAIAWVTSVIQTFVLMYVFYDQPKWNAALLMTAIASLAIALPAVPGSIGPFEAGMVAGLQIAGMADPGNPQSQARAAACAVLIHIVTVASYAFLGVLGLSQERISLGEVVRSARQMASRARNEAYQPGVE